MASSKDFQVEGSVTGYDDEDVRGDGRKKKFKPLSAMRKFFTKRKDKKDSVVAVKAKSTTALPSDDDDDGDEDDGGFKAHSKRSVLAGNRSLSEDSIFSTEPRGQPIASFPKAALSEESLPRSAFQSELMSKLNKRRSEYLDDDQDDGLPHSPVPAVTTVDVILGEPLKKQIGQSGKTSNNRDSDQSLISVDSSENEEEELFLSKWKSSVPARKSATLPATLPATSNKTMDALDFNSIQKTELLVSRAAKHKIKVKPSRKPTRQSVKKRDTSPSPLPSLNEESPTSSKHEDIKEGRISEKVTPSDEKQSDALPGQTSYTAKEKMGAQVAADSKSKVSSIAIGSKSNTGSPLSSPTSPLPPAAASTAAASAIVSPTVFATIPPTVSATLPSPTTMSTTLPSAPTMSTTVQPTVSATVQPTAAVPALPSPTPVEIATSPVSPTARFPPQTGSISDPPHQSLALASSSNHPAAIVAELTAAPKAVEKKIEENLSLSEKGVKTIFTDTQISVKQLSQSQKGVIDSKFDTDIKSRMSQFQNPGIAGSKIDATNSTQLDNLSMKVATPELTSAEALKEENKAKHQIRSRTLPAVMGEQSSSKVHRSRSHRIPNSGADFPEPRDISKVLSDENILSSASVPLSSSLPDAKKSENVKVSSTESKATVSAGEPSWLDIVRRKKSVQEQNIEIEKVKPDEAAATRTSLSSSAPKSIFSSTSYLERKRGSTETVSFKNRELSDATVKKVDSCETKSQSLDVISQNKPTATELSSSKKETIEVEVSNLGSVKASRSIFDSSSKTVGQRDSVVSTSSATSTAVERIRKFSTTSSAISGSASVKAASNTSQDLPVTAAVASEVKSAAPSGGITHTHGGSVKTSFSKTSEVKSSIYTRSGSIKGSSALSATSSSSSEPTASPPVKTETVSAVKPDSLEASTAPPLASPQPSAQHAPAHVTAQPNPSLPSQTPSVTPLTFFVQPFHAYSSKPLANTALATKPAYAAVQPYSKLACTPINNTAQAYPSSKPALIAASSKSVSVPNVKLLTSTSISANSPFALPNVSSSSTNSTNLTPSSSALSSSSSSSSVSNSTRAHSSITASTALKPHSSHISHFNSTSTSSIKKSPSFKTAATSSEKVIPFQKVVVSEKPAADVKKLVTSAKVPAWRTNLPSKEVKIEIIENSPSSAPTSSSQTSSENLRKPQDKVKLQETTKKTEGSSGAGLTVEAEKSTRRTSKVLDMVKNFQNLQAPS